MRGPRTSAQMADDARAMRALAAGKPPPVRCQECGRLSRGVVYLGDGSVLCPDCGERRWATRMYSLVPRSCCTCGRGVLMPGWMYFTPGVCSEWCRAEQLNAQRRVHHEA